MEEAGQSTQAEKNFPWGALLSWTVVLTGFMTFAVYGLGMNTRDVTTSWDLIAQKGQHALYGPPPVQVSVPEAPPVKEHDVEKAVIGTLTAHFESKNNIDAIGYDRAGGTSYGKYQLSSRAGSLKMFVRYLREHEPDWATKLAKSGPANTRGRRGKMPKMWKAIAKENPARFEELQDNFILLSNYEPARTRIREATGLDLDDSSLAVRKVLHSTAVQHGGRGAARIFNQAFSKLPKMEGKLTPKQEVALIEKVYDTRKKCFVRSPKRVRQAVKARLNTERKLAVAMVKNKPDALVASNDNT